jgi:curli biogenesis system outer membrane secretion channel CsgG
MRRALCLVLVTVGVMGTAAAQQPAGLPTLFVAPLNGDTNAIEYWQPALGEGLAEMLITELTKTGKFQVLESTALEELKDEINLGENGWVATDEKVAKGGWAGADFMFRGKVTRFGSKKQGLDLGGFAPKGLGNLGLKMTTSDVRIDWRIVDVANRKVVASGQAVGAEKGVGFDVGLAINQRGGSLGFDNKEFMDSALGKATVKALNTIIANLQTVQVPVSGRQQQKAAGAATAAATEAGAKAALKATAGKVLAVPAKGVLVVSLGSKHGFKAGDKLKLYETVDLKDNDGKVVFTEEKLAGEVTLDAVQDEKSKATYAGDAEVKSGWVVKAE